LFVLEKETSMLSRNEKWLVLLAIVGCVFFASLTPVWAGACLIGLGWMGDARDRYAKSRVVRVWSFRNAVLMTVFGGALVVAGLRLDGLSWSAATLTSPKAALAALAAYAISVLCVPAWIAAYIQRRKHYRMIDRRRSGTSAHTLARFAKCCAVLDIPTAV